jgi:hypothetical protein
MDFDRDIGVDGPGHDIFPSETSSDQSMAGITSNCSIDNWKSNAYINDNL